MGAFDFGPTATALSELVRGVRDDQLGDPTPCTDTSVADMLDHISGLSLAFAAAARKEELPGGGQPHADGSRLPANWRDVIVERLRALAESWRDPSAYTGITMAGPVEMPGDQACLVALDEITVHAWDLAKGTGQEYDADPAAVQACLDFVQGFEVRDDEGGLFGPPVDVPADASSLDKLVGATGRNPNWTA